MYKKGGEMKKEIIFFILFFVILASSFQADAELVQLQVLPLTQLFQRADHH